MVGLQAKPVSILSHNQAVLPQEETKELTSKKYDADWLGQFTKWTRTPVWVQTQWGFYLQSITYYFDTIFLFDCLIQLCLSQVRANNMFTYYSGPADK